MFRPSTRSLLSRAARRLSTAACNAPRPSRPAPAFAGSLESKTSAWTNQISRSGMLYPAGFRHFSAAGDKDLLRILHAELDHERQNYQAPEEVRRGPPAPFKVDDVKGGAELILRRSYGNEDIAITVGIQPEAYPQAEGEEGEEGQEEEELPGPILAAAVSISKDGDKPPLEFHCSIEGDQWAINHVAYTPHGQDFDGVPYDGPDYNLLDDQLKEALERFLHQRGISADLAKYIQLTLEDKEEKEYVNWLDGVAKFVEAK